MKILFLSINQIIQNKEKDKEVEIKEAEIVEENTNKEKEE